MDKLVRQYFIWEYEENGLIKIIFVKLKLNTADIFTKNLGQKLFIRHSANTQTQIVGIYWMRASDFSNLVSCCDLFIYD